MRRAFGGGPDSRKGTLMHIGCGLTMPLSSRVFVDFSVLTEIKRFLPAGNSEVMREADSKIPHQERL